MFRTAIPMLLSLVTLSGFAPALSAADHAHPAKDAKPYPFTTCIVSGEAFGGEMGEPHVFVHEGREVKLCCKSCMKKFKKDPASFTKVIDDGIAAKAASKTPVNPAEEAHKKDHDQHGDDHKNADHKDADKAHEGHDHAGHDHGE